MHSFGKGGGTLEKPETENKGEPRKCVIDVKDLYKIYPIGKNEVRALNGVSFQVYEGEFCAIVGASGSGKSTLLNMLAGLEKPTKGQIMVAGERIDKYKENRLVQFRREKIGFIFQDFNLLDTLTAYENIALALSIQGVKPDEIDARIREVARELDIESVLKKYPYEMSGGQKQRVASARAIITEPKLILADEPTGALDSKSSKMLLEKISYLNIKNMATILMVTHDAFTASYASRVIFIKDGRIFNELLREGRNRKEFFDDIMDVVTMLGGELNDAF